jgi:4-azaleucine resistance transporter AzlC
VILLDTADVYAPFATRGSSGRAQNYSGRGWYRLAVGKRRKDDRRVGEMSRGRAGESPEDGGLADGLRAAVPIVLGYLPAAVAFGIAARAAGLNAIEAVLMSLIVFSGASQFALVGLVAAGAPWFVMGGISLVLGARHVLYGPSLASHLRGTTMGRTAAAAFGLTDEVFAVAFTKLSERRPAGRTSGTDFAYLLGLGTGAYVSWALGTWIGAVAGMAVVVALPSLSSALSFALPALFVALLVSLTRSGDVVLGSTYRPVAVAVLTAALVATALYLAGLESWSVPAAGVSGPVAGLLLGRGRAGAS